MMSREASATIMEFSVQNRLSTEDSTTQIPRQSCKKSLGDTSHFKIQRQSFLGSEKVPNSETLPPSLSLRS
jgi:hypothetical protein